MNTFDNYLKKKLILEDGAPPAAPPMGSPPSGMPPGGPPPPPMGGMGAPPPPMGCGMPPPMGGGMPPPMGGGAGGTAPKKLKAYNVWDALEKILGGDKEEI